MLLKNKIYLHELREQFLQKIVDEWELKWQEAFDEFAGFEAIKSKNAFLETLLVDIEEHLYQRLNGQSNKYLFSKDFLRRFIFEYGSKDVRIQSHPRTAIALYLDYESWEDFLEKNQELEKQPFNINYVNISESFLPALRKTQVIHLTNEPYSTFQEVKPLVKPSVRKYIYGCLGLIVLAMVAYLGFDWWRNRPLSDAELKDVKFEVIKTVGQYPQSVRIMYDLHKLRRVQTVEVELGVGRIVAIDNFVGYFTSTNKLRDTLSQTYFYPGIYRLKLIVNKKIIKTIDHIVYSYPNQWTSWGFGVAFEKNWSTNISTVKNYTKEGILHFDPRDLPNEIKNEDDYRHSVHALTQDFGVGLDSLTLETRMKNPEAAGGESCYNMEMIVMDKNFNHANAEFTMVGCTDYAKLVVGGTTFRRKNMAGKVEDLDEFGVNQDEWNVFKLKLKGNVVEVFVNDKLAFKGIYEGLEKFSELADVRLSFKGAGSIDWVKLSNSFTGKVVYETGFDE